MSITTNATFSDLRKQARLSTDGLPAYRLALLGDSATQHLAVALRGDARARGIALSLFEADYDQLLPQILDPASELYASEPNAVLIYLCTEKLHGRFLAVPHSARAAFAQTVYGEIESHWNRILATRPMQILQYNFVELDDRVFGDYAAKTDESFITQLRRLNELMRAGAAAHKQVNLLDLQRVQNQLGRNTFFDPKFYYVAKMPISMQALPAAADIAIDLIDVFLGRTRKCAVLDLDNTLWGGVIGDDGINGIGLGELGLGRVYTDLQHWLLELKNRGVLLAVCSKNELAAAQEPFLSHSEMVLRLEDIALFVANWEDKATNIRYIQQTLNIGMDSMVFIDDNPFERQAVRSQIPNICVPELPEDPAGYLSCLQGLDLFSTVSYSDTDQVRTEQYRQESSRAQSQQQFGTYDDYLESLSMEATAAPFDDFHLPRIAQLTQRSNQFNLRTVRYTEAEARALAANPDYFTLFFTLRDAFGDYGLVGVVILKKQDEDTLFVDTWLMSCRVLRRGMEEFIADRIMRTAKEAGCRQVIGEYLPTSKNKMVESLYPQMGFAPLGNGRYLADCASYQSHVTHIAPQ